MVIRMPEIKKYTSICNKRKLPCRIVKDVGLLQYLYGDRTSPYGSKALVDTVVKDSAYKLPIPAHSAISPYSIFQRFYFRFIIDVVFNDIENFTDILKRYTTTCVDFGYPENKLWCVGTNYLYNNFTPYNVSGIKTTRSMLLYYQSKDIAARVAVVEHSQNRWLYLTNKDSKVLPLSSVSLRKTLSESLA